MTSKRGSVVSNSAASRSRSSASTMREARSRRIQSLSFSLGGERSAHHVSPPDSDSAWPVIEPAASLTSHSTAAATSLGWMKRPADW